MFALHHGFKLRSRLLRLQSLLRLLQRTMQREIILDFQELCKMTPLCH
jgi:hypothetical protein